MFSIIYCAAFSPFSYQFASSSYIFCGTATKYIRQHALYTRAYSMCEHIFASAVSTMRYVRVRERMRNAHTYAKMRAHTCSLYVAQSVRSFRHSSRVCIRAKRKYDMYKICTDVYVSRDSADNDNGKAATASPRAYYIQRHSLCVGVCSVWRYPPPPQTTTSTSRRLQWTIRTYSTKRLLGACVASSFICFYCFIQCMFVYIEYICSTRVSVCCYAKKYKNEYTARAAANRTARRRLCTRMQ